MAVGDGVRALVFDVFGTVVDWRSGVIRDCTDLGRRVGVDADWAAFADAWRGRYLPSMNRVRTGELPWQNLDALHTTSLDELLVEFGIADAVGAEDRAWLVRAWHRLDPWPDSVAGLERLRERFILAPLSNGNVALLVAMAKRAGLPWDLVLSAELVHHYKPDAETYRSAPELLDLAPNQVMMVAAHLNDLAAAATHGLRTAYIRRPAEWGPAGAAAEPGPEDPVDLVVDSLTELADVLT